MENLKLQIFWGVISLFFLIGMNSADKKSLAILTGILAIISLVVFTIHTHS